MSEKEHTQTIALGNAQSELETANKNLAALKSQVDSMQRRKAAEMDQVETRVKAAIQRKNTTITALRDQLSDAYQQIRTTEAVLTIETASLPSHK